jgi:pimeloyl-ACP methyl ester carboxylesterase
VTGLQAPSPAIDFVSRGNVGPALLFVPGSYSTAAAWRGVWAHLPADWRLVATSLLGCGETAETRRPADADMAHELAVVQAAVARMGGGPVHLVGHSFGGTVALAAALDKTVEVASLALFEANPFDLIAGNRSVYGAARDLAAEFAKALQAGDSDAAGRIIDYWGGAGCFAAMPPRVQEFCRRTAPANALDWETCLGFRPDPQAIAALDCPILLVRGEAAIPAMVAITQALGAVLPAARREEVAGAGHFLISTPRNIAPHFSSSIWRAPRPRRRRKNGARHDPTRFPHSRRHARP